MKSDISVSKTLAWLLRHAVERRGIQLDSAGYADLEQVLGIPELAGATVEQVREIVRTNDKQRFDLRESEGRWQIRANQGHSSRVGQALNDEEMLTPLTEPTTCVHGTYRRFMASIQREGLKAMSRKHVHFACSERAKSGFRPDCEVLIYLDMGRAMADGLTFYRSANGVILTEGPVDPKYFARVVDRKS